MCYSYLPYLETGMWFFEKHKIRLLILFPKGTYRKVLHVITFIVLDQN